MDRVDVAVVGGGYAGVSAARELSAVLPHAWSLLLIDRGSCHQLTTRLPDVIGGKVPPHQACIPYERILGRRVHHLQAEITALDPVTGRIDTTTGPLLAQWLVFALGSAPDFSGTPGASHYGYVVRTVQGAMVLRRRIEELATRRSVVRVGIVGAGYTGTEVAGELVAWDHRLQRAGAPARIQVTVVAQDRRLLPEGNARLARIAEHVLRRKGVSLLLGTPVAAIAADRIALSQGEEVTADVVIWAARSHVVLDTMGIALPTGREGRLRVDPYLRLAGYERVFAAGDDALVYDYRNDRVVRAAAQFAVQEGHVVARNIDREARGGKMEEFLPLDLGEALALGGRDAAAEVGGLVFSGRAALAVKQAALIRYLNGLGGFSLVREYA